MGCKQSFHVYRTDFRPCGPDRIAPIWKNSGSEGARLPIRFSIGRHTKHYVHQTLTARIDGVIWRIQTGGRLVLSTLQDGHEVIVAICKRDRVFKLEPSYDGQAPSGNYKGFPLYAYATVTYRTVFFVNRPQTPAMTVKWGPQNSFEKYLHLCDNPDSSAVASWKYNSDQKLHNVTIREGGIDVALVMLLIPISDLQGEVSSGRGGGGGWSYPAEILMLLQMPFSG